MLFSRQVYFPMFAIDSSHRTYEFHTKVSRMILNFSPNRHRHETFFSSSDICQRLHIVFSSQCMQTYSFFTSSSRHCVFMWWFPLNVGHFKLKFEYNKKSNQFVGRIALLNCYVESQSVDFYSLFLHTCRIKYVRLPNPWRLWFDRPNSQTHAYTSSFHDRSSKHRTNYGTIHISVWFQCEYHIILMVVLLSKWYGSHIATIRKCVWFRSLPNELNCFSPTKDV